MRTIDDYSGILQILLGLIAEKTEFHSSPPLDELLKKEARLIGIFSHSTPLSWVPVMCLLGVEMQKAGGGKRVPLGVMDRFFYDFAPLRPIAHWISQSASPLGFGDLVKHFETFPTADLCVFPEGSNCFFGDPNEIQEFRSPRILELALRANTPIVLGVHRGSESWSKTMHIPGGTQLLAKFLPQLVTKSLQHLEHFNVPLFPKKMPLFQMQCEVYTPALKQSDLVKDRRARRVQLQVEADRMRARMIAMLDELDARIAANSTEFPSSVENSTNMSRDLQN